MGVPEGPPEGVTYKRLPYATDLVVNSAEMALGLLGMVRSMLRVHPENLPYAMRLNREARPGGFSGWGANCVSLRRSSGICRSGARLWGDILMADLVLRPRSCASPRRLRGTWPR